MDKDNDITATPSVASPANAPPTRLSKTMRLDILPNVGVAPFASQAKERAESTHPRPNFGPALFQHLFQRAYDATLITDTKGIILDGNQRAREFLVGQGEDLCGLSVVQVVSGADEALVAHLSSTLASERFARIHAWCQRSDGSYFPAEIAVHRIEADNERYLCFFIRDITWRKEAEEQLQTVNTAIHNARTGIAVADLDGLLVYANPALAVFCGRESDAALQGVDLCSLVSDSKTVRTALDAVLEGKTWSGEIVLRRLDESLLLTACDAVGNVDTEGQLIGMVLSFVDASDRQRVLQAERAIERNRVMMESLGSVCHHLGQPATVLLSSIEMMMRLDERQPEVMQELLNLSLSAADSLRAILRELNDLRQYRSEPYLAQTAPEGRRIVSLP